MCGTCARIVLMALNVVMLLAGLALLGVVLWVKFDGSSMPTIRDNIELIEEKAEKAAQYGGGDIIDKVKMAITIAFWVLIGFSAACVILALLGLCGAGSRSSCLLEFYASLLILLVLLEVGFCIFIFVYRPKVKDEVDKCTCDALSLRVQEHCKPYCAAVHNAWNAIDDGLLIAGIAALILVLVQILAIFFAFIAACCNNC
ncbi:CRE-TSP-3 protein [Aphelenchoides avenae]|nr:CRE-TSP-3 protein [Aphelenchus avenae]